MPSTGLNLTDTTWNLRFADLTEKAELLAYAASKGYPIGREVDSNDLGLGWNERQGKLYSFAVEWAGQPEPGRPCQLISAFQFRLLVQAAPRPKVARVAISHRLAS